MSTIDDQPRDDAVAGEVATPAAGAAPTGPIQRLLVANRGEIARRIFATCRAMGIATVAVHSDVDADAPFVREADRAVALGGAAPAESYLRADAILAAAQATGADAIHPGYGFLAEDAHLAAAVTAAGLRWIGPSAETMRAMGSKLRARELMEAAGVPVLPGGVVAEDATEDALRRQAAAIGFPLLVKASAGGGGRGMRTVREPAALVAAVAAARHEAQAAFGDGTVFLERYVVRPRHVEVQILGDTHGTLSVLPERDCSIQRRHQKLIEESPAPAIDDAVRARLADAARQAAGALGYVSAGTVEFVLSPDGDAFFLEVNTRLQVEHPVTELVCGLDLVALQLRIAEGEPLPPEAIDPVARGHAIEARLVAEDPAAGWLPQTGVVEQFAFPDAPAAPGRGGDTTVRVDRGVEPGSTVSPHYDSLLAKVIVGAPTRAAAIRRLADLLARARLAGPGTARDLLVRVLESESFATAGHDTQLLDGEALPALSRPLVSADDQRWAAVAAAFAAQAHRRVEAEVLPTAPSGWRNVPAVPQTVVYEGPDGPLEVAYRLDRRGALAELRVDGTELDAALLVAEPTRVQLRIDGVRRSFSVFAGTDALWVSGERGQVALRERPRFPDRTPATAAGSLTAPLPGTVLRVLAAVGDPVTARQPLLVLEAMKMEHEVVAATDGTLATLAVAVGDQVQGGQTLAVVAPADAEDVAED